MSSEEVVISVRNLTKTYRLFGHPGDRIKQCISLGLAKYYRDFTALNDVSFDIKKGETVGLIGRNGSGKSTLLQIICGILKPSSGTVQVKGRVAALLELGAGFNPEFTGRENVYFQGALMGLSKVQMREKFDTIVAFADIGPFIDQPVRTYSSGMFVRLAFAVAVHVDPDVLVIDEAITVGDPGFRARCFRRIAELRSIGCTILFVSHDMDEITRLCSRAILLDGGEQLASGPPHLLAGWFQRLLNMEPEMQAKTHEWLKSRSDGLVGHVIPPAELEPAETGVARHTGLAYEPNGAIIEYVQLQDGAGHDVVVLRTGEKYRCRFGIHFLDSAQYVRCAILIKTLDGVRLGGAWTASSPEGGLAHVMPNQTAVGEFEFTCRLNPGGYLVSLAVFASEAGIEYALHGLQNALQFRVIADKECIALGAVDFGCRAALRLRGPTGCD